MSAESQTPVARVWPSRRHVMAPTNTHATIGELLEAVFSVRSLPRIHNEDQLSLGDSSCVEAGSDTSTVALRIAGGDEEGTQCLGI
jgi:hypothetical protein